MRIFEQALRLSQNDGFLHFQHILTQKIYDALGKGYADKNYEVPLVGKAADAINGENYGGIRIVAKKIHGNTSMATFNYRAVEKSRELGDTVIISLITDGPERLFQKISIVQNKRDRNSRWEVDPVQLFLLKNFPPIKRGTGVCKPFDGTIFRNNSGTLGCYGLFSEPGDLTMISAPAVAEILRNKQYLSPSDIYCPPEIDLFRNGTTAGNSQLGMPFTHLHPKEIMMYLDRIHPRRGWPQLALSSPAHFFGNTHFMRDTHDFVRNWTQFNFGEPTISQGRVVNEALDDFATRLLMMAGFDNLHMNREINHKFDFVIEPGVLLVNYMDIDRFR